MELETKRPRATYKFASSSLEKSLADPSLQKHFREYLNGNLAAENFDFWLAVTTLEGVSDPEEQLTQVLKLQKRFLRPESKQQVNISGKLSTSIHQNIQHEEWLLLREDLQKAKDACLKMMHDRVTGFFDTPQFRYWKAIKRREAGEEVSEDEEEKQAQIKSAQAYKEREQFIADQIQKKSDLQRLAEEKQKVLEALCASSSDDDEPPTKSVQTKSNPRAGPPKFLSGITQLNGTSVVVEIPENAFFEDKSKFFYQLSAADGPASLYIQSGLADRKFVIGSSTEAKVKVHWSVRGH